jgi:hypothetical protein
MRGLAHDRHDTAALTPREEIPMRRSDFRRSVLMMAACAAVAAAASRADAQRATAPRFAEGSAMTRAERPAASYAADSAVLRLEHVARRDSRMGRVMVVAGATLAAGALGHWAGGTRMGMNAGEAAMMAAGMTVGMTGAMRWQSGLRSRDEARRLAAATGAGERAR